jgi:hypothetical protein
MEVNPDFRPAETGRSVHQACQYARQVPAHVDDAQDPDRLLGGVVDQEVAEAGQGQNRYCVGR